MQMPDRLFAGITVVGKGAVIPDGAYIGRNVLINSGRDESAFLTTGSWLTGRRSDGSRLMQVASGLHAEWMRTMMTAFWANEPSSLERT